jgi:hypothetical protein
LLLSIRVRIGALVLVALAAGCIDKAERGPADTTANAGSAGAAGNAGSAGSGGSGGADPRCAIRTDYSRFGFGVLDPDGTSYPVNYDVGGSFTLRGTVRSVESASFGVSVEGEPMSEAPTTNAGGAGGEGGSGDSPGGAGGDRGSGLWTVSAEAPELVLPINEGMVVDVAISSSCQPFSGCNRTIVVRDALADGETVLLAMYAGQFGRGAGVDAFPAVVELVDLGCSYPAQPGGIPGPVKWALRMQASDNPASSLLLHAGESGELSLQAGSNERWFARNVNSHDSGGFDASTSLHFYLVKRP